MPGQWAGSRRRDTLPSDWATRIRPAILDRDNHQCTWIGDLHEDGRPRDYITAVELNLVHQILNRCQAAATDVDHIGPREDHTSANLRSLCPRHHGHRSSLQGNQAKAERGRLRLRPHRPHPGLKSPE